jgi:hypothetical protein
MISLSSRRLHLRKLHHLRLLVPRDFFEALFGVISGFSESDMEEVRVHVSLWLSDGLKLHVPQAGPSICHSER